MAMSVQKLFPKKSHFTGPGDQDLSIFWGRQFNTLQDVKMSSMASKFLLGATESTAQSCPTLCNPMDCSPPGSSVRGILQATILEQGSISSSGRSSQPRDRTHVSCISCIARQIFYHQGHLGNPTWSMCDLCAWSLSHVNGDIQFTKLERMKEKQFGVQFRACYV